MAATDATVPTAPLWRAAQVFRLLSCGYALGFQLAVNNLAQAAGGQPG